VKRWNVPVMQIAAERNVPDRAAGERAEFVAAITRPATADYVRIRAIIATANEREDRIARLTAMGRDVVSGIRRRVRAGDAATLLAETPSLHERVLEAATRQIVADGGRELLAMQRLARDAGIPRRTLYNLYAAPELDAACRRRSQTIWRARFEQSVLAAAFDPKQRLVAVIDVLDAWVGSERFRIDRALWARPSAAERAQDDDLREHVAEIDRFATALAVAAGLAAPGAFGAFVATAVAGISAWYDRRADARAASIAFVEHALARHR
jgi:AcrR family transcriptional regulator